MKFHHLYFRWNLGDAVPRYRSTVSEFYMAVRLTQDQGGITPNFARCDSDFTAWVHITFHWPVCQQRFLKMTKSILCSLKYKQSRSTIYIDILGTGHEQSPFLSCSECFTNDVARFVCHNSQDWHQIALILSYNMTVLYPKFQNLIRHYS